MGEIMVKEKEITVPGQVLAKGMDYLPAGGAFREGDTIIASQVGVINIAGRLIKVIPLNARYIPKRGDTVIGKVTDISFNGWYVDIGDGQDALLSLKEATSEFIGKDVDLTQYYDFGNYIVATIVRVTKSKMVDLTTKGPGLRKLTSGKIIKVASAKVPRIIGKQGSMISLVKEATGCRIVVGQNGLVWILGTDPFKEKVATEAILKIDKESHTEGLTDKIKAFLDSRLGSEKNV